MPQETTICRRPSDRPTTGRLCPATRRSRVTPDVINGARLLTVSGIGPADDSTTRQEQNASPSVHPHKTGTLKNR